MRYCSWNRNWNNLYDVPITSCVPLFLFYFVIIRCTKKINLVTKQVCHNSRTMRMLIREYCLRIGCALLLWQEEVLSIVVVAFKIRIGFSVIFRGMKNESLSGIRAVWYEYWPKLCRKNQIACLLLPMVVTCGQEYPNEE